MSGMSDDAESFQNKIMSMSFMNSHIFSSSEERPCDNALKVSLADSIRNVCFGI